MSSSSPRSMSSGAGGAPRRARSSATVWPPNSGPAVDRRYDGSGSLSFSPTAASASSSSISGGSTTAEIAPRRPDRDSSARRPGLPGPGSAVGRVSTAGDAAGARRSPPDQRRPPLLEVGGVFGDRVGVLVVDVVVLDPIDDFGLVGGSSTARLVVVLDDTVGRHRGGLVNDALGECVLEWFRLRRRRDRLTIGISPVSSATVTESVSPRRRRRRPPTGGAPIVPFFASNSATEIGRVLL